MAASSVRANSQRIPMGHRSQSVTKVFVCAVLRVSGAAATILSHPVCCRLEVAADTGQRRIWQLPGPTEMQLACVPGVHQSQRWDVIKSALLISVSPRPRKSAIAWDF